MNNKGKNEFAALELVVLTLFACFFVYEFVKIIFL